MSYSKQNFTSGSKLYASQLNAMDEQIEQSAEQLQNLNNVYQPKGNYITSETDPTVPDWAKEETKPSYTANEVNADPAGTAASLVAEHNSDDGAHADIRKEISDLASSRYTNEEIDNKISVIPKFTIDPVDSLPELSTASLVTVYIVASGDEDKNVYTEFICVEKDGNRSWEKLGTQTLDLSGYSTTEEMSAEIARQIASALAGYSTTTEMQTAISTALKDYAKTSAIPTKLSQLEGDATHRTVTDAEKTGWNSKADGDHNHDSVYIKETRLNEAVNTALQTAKDSGDFDGTSVTITKVTESTESGGSNVVEFSDSKSLTVKNGKDGYTPVKDVDFFDGEDGDDGDTPYIGTNGNWWIGDTDTGTIANGMTQVTPLYAESIEWLNEHGEQDKLYLLPDGFIYHYAEVEVEVEVDGGGCTNVLDTYTPTINKRWSHSSKGHSDADGYMTVGPVPVKPEDEVRINVKYITGHKFFSAGYCRVHYFDASGNYVSGTNDRAIYRDEKLIVEGDTTKWVVGYANATDNNPDTNTKMAGYDNIVSMVCVFCVNEGVAITEADVADLVMTINEPIVEGGGGPTTEIQKVWQWTNTGHAFIPADYEDRIADVEERAASNTTRIIALENGGKTVATTKEQAWENLKTWRKPVFEDAPVFLLNSDKPAITNIEGADKGLYAKYNALQTEHPDYISEPETLCTGSDGVTPIYAYRFCEPSALYHSGFTMVEDKPTIIIVSGVHPSEVAGSHSVYHAMEEITTNPELADLRRNVEFIVVPMINPTASAALHYDFEVDHNPSKTAEPYTMSESNALADLINRYQSNLALVMSCHSNDIDTYFGQCIGWVSSGDYFTSIVGARLADKLSKAWVEKYNDKLPAGLAEANAYVKTTTTTSGAIRWPQAVTLPVTDQRMVKVCMSNSGGTEYKQAHKVGAFGVNVEGCARCIPLDRNAEGKIDYSVSCTANVATTGCELYVNYLRTFLSAWSRLDKSEYAHDLPWVE